VHEPHLFVGLGRQVGDGVPPDALAVVLEAEAPEHVIEVAGQRAEGAQLAAVVAGQRRLDRGHVVDQEVVDLVVVELAPGQEQVVAPVVELFEVEVDAVGEVVVDVGVDAEKHVLHHRRLPRGGEPVGDLPRALAGALFGRERLEIERGELTDQAPDPLGVEEDAVGVGRALVGRAVNGQGDEVIGAGEDGAVVALAVKVLERVPKRVERLVVVLGAVGGDRGEVGHRGLRGWWGGRRRGRKASRPARARPAAPARGVLNV
jgi:hypothetical protein